MKKPSFPARLRYAFDNTLSRGPVALIGWLGMITLVLIVCATLLDLAIGGTSEQLGPFQVFWSILSQALTPNPVDAGNPWQFLLVMLLVTLGSLFLVSMLIGLLNASIQHRVEALRRGRSPVIEKGHTVILGWSEQIFTIISELMIANEHHRRFCIVVLSERDKVEMEEAIRSKVKLNGRTRVVCRTGSPIAMDDLDLVSLQTARSIIVVGGDREHGDIQTIKTLLAIVNAPDRRTEPYHIVAQIRSPKNLEIARMAGRDEVELVLVGDVVARIIAQTCRQSGLSAVYTELLNFEGVEMYFHAEPGLVGKTFGEALFAFEDSALIGLCPQDGPAKLNPPMDTRIREGDQLIVIAEDDDTIHLSGRTVPAIDRAVINPCGAPAPRSPERTLILGWNWRAPTIIEELGEHEPAGSQVTVVAEDTRGEIEKVCARAQTRGKDVRFQPGDTTDRHLLDDLAIPTYGHVVLLCYSDRYDQQMADARTLATLLHLREIAEQCGHTFSIVSEMLDVRNRDLAEVTHADDFIVSDQLISFLVAQIAETKGLNAVFSDIFDAEGSEIYIRPIVSYILPDLPVNFHTVIEAARERGEVAIGYRLQAYEDDKEHSYGIVLNPPKSVVVTFAQRDRLVVLAES